MAGTTVVLGSGSCSSCGSSASSLNGVGKTCTDVCYTGANKTTNDAELRMRIVST